MNEENHDRFCVANPFPGCDGDCDCGAREPRSLADAAVWKERAEKAQASRAAARAHEADLVARAEKAEAEVTRLLEGARDAYETLLGDTDHSAWHSEHCYIQRTFNRRVECVCGLDAALKRLRGMWEHSTLADNPPKEPSE